MKEVNIISTIVGRGTDKNITGKAPSMGAYALKSDVSALQALFNDFLEGDDTDNIINKWKELESFLNGISEDIPLTSILGNYIPISGYTEILGEKNFTGGLKVNGSPIYYDTEKKYWKIEGDLLVTGGVSMYSNDTAFTPSTIMDAIVVDNVTIIKQDGKLVAIGGGGTGGGGVADSVAWGNVLGKPSWITDTAPIIGISGVNVSIGSGISQSSLRTALGLGSNAYSSTAFLPLTGGTLTGSLEIKTNSSYVHFKDANGIDRGSLGVLEDNNASVWKPSKGWKTILDADNYSSYALPLSGGTINGSGDYLYVPLYINALNNQISGITFKTNGAERGHIGYSSGLGIRLHSSTAAGIAVSDSDVPIFYTADGSIKNTIWHSGNDGSGSGLNADLLDGAHLMGKEGLSGIIMSWSRASFSTINQYFGNGNIVVFDPLPTDASSSDLGYNTVVVSYGDNSERNHQLAYSIYENYNPKYRRNVDGVWSEWKTFAFTSDNVASATKLATARTIWGQSFDGTGNVSGEIYTSSHSLLGTYGGAFLYAGIRDGEALSIEPLDSNGAWLNRGITLLKNGNVGFGTANPSQKIHVVGNILVTGGTTMYSARKLKTIQDERGLSLEELSIIKPTRFTWKDGRDNRLHIGGIADDVQKVLPEVIYKTGEDDTLTMDYGNAAFAIAASLIKPMISHEEEIKALKNRIKELEEQVKTLSWNIA